jgi:hypothetical protein
MKAESSLRTILLYGFMVWLIPFIVGFAAFPAKTNFAPFFETIMAVTLALSGVTAGGLYFRKIDSGFVRYGTLVGLSWFVICLAIDSPFFLLGGPMQMTIPNYLMDIGLEYLIYPIITIGFGYYLEHR